MPLVGKAHRDAVSVERPEFLDEPVLQLLVPFAREELHDGFASLQELRSIAPNAVRSVGERDLFRVTCVPRVLSQANFLRGGLRGEWREGWAWIFSAHVAKG